MVEIRVRSEGDMDQNVQQILDRYVAGAVMHGEGTDAGDADRTNAGHDQVIAALRALRALGESGHDVLSELMSHSNPSVRCWAATHSLPIDEARATEVLQDLAGTSGPCSLDAEIVLEEWQKGTLRTS